MTRGDDDLREIAGFTGSVVFRVFLEVGGDLGVIGLDAFAQGLAAEGGIAQGAPLGTDEARLVVGVELLELRVGGRAGRRECGGRDHGYRTAAALLERAGIGARNRIRDLRAVSSRDDRLAEKQRGADLAAQLRVGQALRLEEGLVSCFLEVAAGSTGAGNLADFAVDEVATCTKAVLLAPCDQDETVDQAVEDFIEAVVRQQRLDGRVGVVLPRLAQCLGRTVAKFGGRDLLASDHCNTVAARNAAECAGAGHVHAGESEADQAEKCEGDGKADLRLEEIPEKGEHDLRSGLFSALGAPASGREAVRHRFEQRALSALRPRRNRSRPLLTHKQAHSGDCPLPPYIAPAGYDIT